MVSKTLDVASLSTLSKRMFLAESAGIYKPAKAMYEGLLRYVNNDTQEQVPSEKVWLVSGYVVSFRPPRFPALARL
jgi:2-haloacid dehalogenase